MNKKIVVFLVIMAVFNSLVWAGGGRDNHKRSAEDPSGFTDTLDTAGRKPGKSNYYLEAIDKAGNVTLAGPANIFFKPESDLPNTIIINPVPDMRVQGNMNVVGIAFDDDGIASVELTVTRGNDGKGEELVRVTVQGTDFWSYFLDTTNSEIWTDGHYTITAWSTDITGISGISENFNSKVHKKSVIHWQLDRKKPETIVTSHDIGALVSGNVRLRGTVTDGNGIKEFNYSVDEGTTYLPVKISLDKRSGGYNWEVNINSAKLEDGPAVIWMKAVDGNNSVGTAAHLLFVNNKKPDIQIVYPEQNSVVNGIFSIAGYASHPVGLKSLSWKAGNISGGQIEIFPGNEWWSAEIDLRGQKISSIDIDIRAEDVSGNVTIFKQKYKVDQNKDLPVVTLLSPVPGNIDAAAGIFVKGRAADDDGIASIFYSLDSGAAVEFPSNGDFQFLITDIAPGTHNLDVWAKDITGVLSQKVSVKGLTTPPPLPQPGITSFTFPGSKPAIAPKTFYTGMTIKPEPKMTMNVSFKASAAPASASVTVGDSSPIPLKLAASKELFTASVVFPDNQPEGLTTIRLQTVDRLGREVVYNEYVFLSSQTPQTVREEVTNEFGEVRVVERQVMPSTPFVFSWARPNTLNDGRMLLLSADDSVMGISSLPVTSVTVNGAGANNISASADDYGRVIINAVQEGEFGPFTLTLRTDSGTQQSPSFRISSAFTAPVITLQGVVNNNWVRTSVPVRFNVASRSRITSVEHSFDMGETWISFGQAASDYNRTLDLTAVEDGLVSILIRATSEAGMSSIAQFSVLKDTIAPMASIVMPIEDAGVNGTIRMAFNVEEFGELQTVVYRRPAAGGAREITKELYNINSWEKNYGARFIEVLMDSIEMPLAANMRFTFTDRAGNSSDVTAWPFTIDQAADIPVVHIILPLEDEVITTDFIVSGVMFDDDDIKNIQWRMDNGAWQTIEATAGFSIPVIHSGLTDNEHTITVIAEDIFGVKSAPVSRKFRVSLIEPAAAIQFPLYDTVLKEGIEVRGTASDRNGIKDVLVSLDNGNTYNNAKGNFGTASETTQWTYQFNTTILKDGPNVMFIRVIDRYDIAATYASMINVDNTAPEIILDSPGDGAFSVGNVSVMGRIIDQNLKEIDIQLRSLDGATVSTGLRSRKIEPMSIIREVFDLTGQQDGNYNIAVIATDLANNVSRISRNFQLARQTFKNTIEILYPLENETVTGEFYLYGHTSGANKAEEVTIRINGRDYTVSEVDDAGFYRFTLNSENLIEGNNTILVHSNFGTAQNVQSRSYSLKYRSAGPWVRIDSFSFGNFAYERPYLYGRNGYILNEEDKEALEDKSVDNKIKNQIKAKIPDFTEISFDNGRTFVKTEKGKKNADYRYRLETGEMQEGTHYIIVRTTMKNGEVAVARMVVQVDKTPPVIRLISPEEGGVYNTSIMYSATATDDVELAALNYYLRSGDKAAYAVPGFLQGLYIEGVIPPFIRQIAVDKGFDKYVPSAFAGGATYTDFGLGLSFFDDNVKIQAQYGFMHEKQYKALGGDRLRYGGHVIGIKLLANLYTLPFAVFGPDWQWLFASFSLGANFSLFDFLDEDVNQNETPTWLSAILAQIEFPKVTIKKRKFLRTFSFFIEGQLWFLPTDVKADADPDSGKEKINTVIPRFITGLRLYIF